MTQIQSSSPFRVPTGARNSVDVFALDAESEPLGLPTVRIFVATRNGHERAERVIAWSIREHRSKNRSYAIHFMRPNDESGGPIEDAAGWVPQLCGGKGLALFCTVDQVYLSDPAPLLDLDMGAHALLGPIAADDLLVMDCEKLVELAVGSSSSRSTGGARDVLRIPGDDLRGPIPADWDVIGEHYASGRSRRVRYAAPHTQPWRPFPDRFVYQNHPNADLWQDLERDANRAGFEILSRSSPSRRFSMRFRSERPKRRPEQSEHASNAGALPTGGLHVLLDAVGSELVTHEVCIRESLARLRNRRMAVYTLDAGEAWHAYLAEPLPNHPQLPVRWGAKDVRILDLDDPSAGSTERATAVLCVNTLDSVPSEDLPWVLAEVFENADSLVHLGIRPDARSAKLRARGGDPIRRTLGWWIAQIEVAAGRWPDVHWQAVFSAGDATQVRHGGRHIGDGFPAVWVLTDDRPGNTSQSTGLAKALGWPYSIKSLRFSQAARLHNRILGASRLGINNRRSSPLGPPWPDLVIAAGRRSAPVAQWIRKRNFGQTRLVQLGRKGGDAADHFDLVVTPSYGRLDPHPRRLVTSAPLNNVDPESIRGAIDQSSHRLADTKRPRIAVLVGGWSGQYQLDARAARVLGEKVVALAREVGGSILATTSRRAGKRGSDAFCAALPPDAKIHRWSASDGRENPYLAFLGLADAFVITGDSESMLTEAASLGRPIYIYPLPERASFRWMRVGRDWVYARAHTRRGGVATQRGLEYWCARLIDLGFVRPVRDLRDLHDGLIREGVARHFGDSFDTNHCKALGDEEKVVERVCALLGFREKK